MTDSLIYSEDDIDHMRGLLDQKRVVDVYAFQADRGSGYAKLAMQVVSDSDVFGRIARETVTAAMGDPWSKDNMHDLVKDLAEAHYAQIV